MKLFDFLNAYKQPSATPISPQRLVEAIEHAKLKTSNVEVEIRDNFILFHDKGNSLVKRKPHYEPDIRNALAKMCDGWIKRNKLQPLMFVDIGANIGLHTLYIKNKYPKARIHSFDASPQSYTYLNLTREFNKLDDLTVYNFGLSDKTGTLDFFNWGSESSADSLYNTTRVDGVPNILKVQVNRLDDVLPTIPPSVIKIDTEGCEMIILNGADKIIQNARPYILVEMHPTNMKAAGIAPQDFMDWAKKYDYQIFTCFFKTVKTATDIERFQQKGIEDFILLPQGISL
jgi:FkbM family methyltransferase